MPNPRAETAALLDDLVEHWFFETFHGSALARSTETWNAVHGAKEELKRRLATFVADNAANIPED